MARATQWSDLRTGLAVIGVSTALVLFILIFGRLGRIPGETYRVHVRAPEARGIIRGSEVWLAGQKVGAVRDIEILPPSAGPDSRVLLEVELTARHRDALRRDSKVDIRAGGSLIGAPVVYVSIGTPEAAVVAPGDTLQAVGQVDLASMADRFGTAADELPAILADVSTLGTLMRSPDGSLGAFMHEGGRRDVAATRARASAIAERVRSGRGTAGLALRQRGELMARARLAMSRADSVRTLLASPGTSLGRFRRDSTLARNMAEIRDEVSIVRALMTSPDGTIGRLASDSALVASLAQLEAELGRLMADVKEHPLRYISF